MTDLEDDAREERREEREVQLGIELRDRGERLLATIQALIRVARILVRAIIVAGVLVLVVIGAFAVVLVWIHSSLDTGQDTRNRIVDCVEPGGNCYARGQQQTGDAVGSINKISVLAAACSVDPKIAALPIDDRIAAIDKCTRDHYQK